MDLTDYFKYDEGSYTSGSIEYPLRDLDIGLHTVTIIVCDNLANSSSSDISFDVDDCEDGLFDVIPYPSPFEAECYFTFGISTEADVRIAIYTQSGRLLRELHEDAMAPFAKIHWDGEDENANEVGNGTYIYHIDADFGNSSDSFTGKIAKIR